MTALCSRGECTLVAASRHGSEEHCPISRGRFARSRADRLLEGRAVGPEGVGISSAERPCRRFRQRAFRARKGHRTDRAECAARFGCVEHGGHAGNVEPAGRIRATRARPECRTVEGVCSAGRRARQFRAQQEEAVPAEFRDAVSALLFHPVKAGCGVESSLGSFLARTAPVR
jgi:hypothetical protein